MRLINFWENVLQMHFTLISIRSRIGSIRCDGPAWQKDLQIARNQKGCSALARLEKFRKLGLYAQMKQIHSSTGHTFECSGLEFQHGPNPRLFFDTAVCSLASSAQFHFADIGSNFQRHTILDQLCKTSIMFQKTIFYWGFRGACKSTCCQTNSKNSTFT